MNSLKQFLLSANRQLTLGDRPLMGLLDSLPLLTEGTLDMRGWGWVGSVSGSEAGLVRNVCGVLLCIVCLVGRCCDCLVCGGRWFKRVAV